MRYMQEITLLLKTSFLSTFKIIATVLLGLGLLIAITAGLGLAAEEKIVMKISEHRFVPSELTLKVGVSYLLKVTNTDKTSEEFESPDLNREKMILPGQTVTIRLPKLKAGVYTFFGEFHPDTAHGTINVTK